MKKPELPEMPRKEDGSVDWSVVGETAKDGAIVGAKAFDKGGQLAAKHAIIPAINGGVKLAARGVVAGTDLVRERMDKEPIAGTPKVEAIRAGYNGMTDWLDGMSVRAKVMAYRAVYATSLLAALYGGGKMMSSDSSDAEDGRPEIVDVRNDRDNVRQRPRGQRREVREQRREAPMAFENGPVNERIPNLDGRLSLVSLYESSDPEGEQSGARSYEETINQFLTDLRRTGDVSSFKLYKSGRGGRLEEVLVGISGGRVTVGGRRVRVRRGRDGKTRFSAAFIRNIVAYKVVSDGVDNIGFAPNDNQANLESTIRGVVGDEDITMLNFRGHTSYGANVNISSGVLDPAFTSLGGCNSSDYLRGAHATHGSTPLVSLNQGTNWTENHLRAKEIMRILKGLKESQRGRVSWGDFNRALRSSNTRWFRDGEVNLPGDTQGQTSHRMYSNNM